MMQWEELLNTERHGATEKYKKIPDGRNGFERDQDKILFSCSFRRLTHKTQVHPLPDNDHIHNRLSHSLEVASVGRTLGYKVGGYLKKKGFLKGIKVTPQDIGHIVEAACLAHDIGNPPFGHSGESAIREWFREGNGQKLLEHFSNESRIKEWFSELKSQELTQDIVDKDIITKSHKLDFVNFEGNAQGLRILTQLEYFLFKGGMRLTYATLGAFLKYPWTSNTEITSKKKKYGCNQSEIKILQDIAKNTGLIEIEKSPDDNKYHCCRHPLSYLMEAADDICYKIIDLEDGLEMGLISFDEFEKVTRINSLKKRVPEEYKSISPNSSNRRKIAVVRSAVMNHWIDKIYKIFISNLDPIMNGKLDDSLTNILKRKDKSFEIFMNKCDEITREKIFNHPKKIETEIASHSLICVLLDAFMPTICKRYFCKKEVMSELNEDPNFLSNNDPKEKNKVMKSKVKGYMTFKEIRILDLLGTNIPDIDHGLYDSMMIVNDYISGMTDRYATYLVSQIRGIM